MAVATYILSRDARRQQDRGVQAASLPQEFAESSWMRYIHRDHWYQCTKLYSGTPHTAVLFRSVKHKPHRKTCEIWKIHSHSNENFSPMGWRHVCTSVNWA